MYREETLSYVEITQVPWKLPVDTQSVDAWNGFEEQVMKTKIKKPAPKNSAPTRQPRAQELCFRPAPQAPVLFADPCRGGLSNTEAQRPELPATWPLAAAPISVLRGVCCFLPKINCSERFERVGLGWMGCFSDLNTHPAQMLFYFVPLLRWLLLFLLEMKSGNPESDEKEAGVSRVGGVEAR